MLDTCLIASYNEYNNWGKQIMRSKKYSDSFKEQVVKEAVEVRNNAAIARKYGISASVVAKWIKNSSIETPMDKMRSNAVGNKKKELLSDFKEVDKIEEQNIKLKKLIGDKELEIEILRELIKKKNLPLPPR